ncbi:Flavin-containing monooxygenase FMO GS-OX-like 2 [Phytophthora citrophthora]|uniref:Flavin-containing monooxygenase FMO GS-OX-like 2 n=1 Tax=Phytophthora citrophthora TaxID=4793 RepID=A0AAD9LRH9_9STRA|nr:Flavin-containing monooxygenase FMO GS-OX-like 2 [Phytophthora citrophthora]
MSSHLGGVWKYDDSPDSASSVVYESLHTNIPTSSMQLHDFPFKKGLPSFPSHSDVLEYLETYAQHFGVDVFVRTDTKVTKASKVGTQWRIHVESKHKGIYFEDFDRLVVANGHHNKHWEAPIKGIDNFTGIVSHARSYRSPKPYRNKRVLIIGRGPSGQDISLELAKSGAKEVYVAAFDYDPNVIDEKDKRILKAVVDYIAKDGTVVFTDGSTIAAPDEILHCTGYLYTATDFFPSELLALKSNTVNDEALAYLSEAITTGLVVAPLYKHIFPIKDPTAAFIGLPVSVPPFQCFELQSRWVARVFDGSVDLPCIEEMYNDFSETLRNTNGSARKLHSLSGYETEHITELGILSGSIVDDKIYEMYEDAAYLRVNFPHDFRSADFSLDPATGKWVRRYKPSSNAAELVRVFS